MCTVLGFSRNSVECSFVALILLALLKLKEFCPSGCFAHHFLSGIVFYGVLPCVSPQLCPLFRMFLSHFLCDRYLEVCFRTALGAPLAFPEKIYIQSSLVPELFHVFLIQKMAGLSTMLSLHDFLTEGR